MSGEGATDYAVDVARPADEARIRELLRNLIGETRITRWTPEFWAWKHRENPFGPSWIACARTADHDEVVCVQHAMRWELVSATGERVRAVRQCDGATAPAHQRRGLYTATEHRLQAELSKAEVALAFGTPNEKTLGMELKTGWKLAGRLRFLARPIASLSSWLASGRPGDDGLAPQVAVVGALSLDALIARHGEEQVAALVAAHERQRRRTGLRTPRDLPFLLWRYQALPTAEYGAWAAPAGNLLDGFLLFRVARGAGGRPALVITEMFLRDPRIGPARRLVRCFLRASRACYALGCFARGTVEAAALRRNGFLPSPGHRPPLTVRQYRPLPRTATELGSWDLTLGEMEIF